MRPSDHEQVFDTTIAPRHVMFLCLRNRVRSVFAELFIRQLIAKKCPELSETVTVSSAGYYPKEVRDFLADINVPPPEPFYSNDMSSVLRKLMHEKGMTLPDVWLSKELTPKMVKTADLIVVSVDSQKKELVSHYSEFNQKFVTLKEMANHEEATTFDSFVGVPMEGDVWGYCEENQQYVSQTIQEVERLLIKAFPRLVGRKLL